jgi:pseudouridine kinase
MPHHTPSLIAVKDNKTPTAPVFIAVVGAANMDISAQTTRVLAATDSTPGLVHCAPGGVARNVAENLARLGHAVRLVSVVGDDDFGRSLTQATRRAGVNMDNVQVFAEQRTATYLSLHGPDGDMAVAVNDMAILDCMTPEFLQAHAPVLGGASAMVVDCNLSPAALAGLFKESLTSPVFVDAVSVVKSTRIAPWLSRIHTLKVNRLEAQALSGMVVQSVDDAGLAASRLHQLGVRNVVLSLGDMGVCWTDAQGHSGYRQAAPTKVVNTSGAGDALLAGLVHAHMRSMPLDVAVEFAMACAELTLSSTFANTPELSVTAVNRRLSSKSDKYE